MTTFLAALLVIHVLAGIVAVGIYNVTLMHLLKRTPDYPFLARITWAAFALILMSWVTAAYYYVTFYGSAVKPRILSGAMPAAHTFFMETKEHIFLLLPFLSLSIALSVTYLRMQPDDSLRSATALLTFVALIVGTAVAASGIIVSGAI